MQPWNFILISSAEKKEKLAWAAEKERRALAIRYEEEAEKETKFLNLKVEGLKEAPVTIVSHVIQQGEVPMYWGAILFRRQIFYQQPVRFKICG